MQRQRVSSSCHFLRVRNFSFSIVGMLLNTYPRLCSNNAELFTTFLKFLQSSRRPAWNSPHFLEIVETFVKVGVTVNLLNFTVMMSTFPFYFPWVVSAGFNFQAYNVDRSHQRYICKEVEVNMGSAEVSCGINLLEIFPAVCFSWLGRSLLVVFTFPLIRRIIASIWTHGATGCFWWYSWMGKGFHSWYGQLIALTRARLPCFAA